MTGSRIRDMFPYDGGVGMANTSNAIFPDTRLRNAFRDERDLPLHESSRKKIRRKRGCPRNHR